MAGESDTLIASLNARINELTVKMVTLTRENRDTRLKLREEEKQHGELKTAHTALTTDRDTWKTKAEADPPALQLKLDEAQAQLRSRDHKDAWKAALGDQLGDKVTVEDVWAKLDYKPKEKIPTAAEITEQVKPAQGAAPYLFKAGPRSASGTVVPQKGGPPLVTAVPASRGASDSAARGFEVRKSNSRDPKWMRENQKQIEEARKAGALVFTDD
jgi:hypothetical protein